MLGSPRWRRIAESAAAKSDCRDYWRKRVSVSTAVAAGGRPRQSCAKHQIHRFQQILGPEKRPPKLARTSAAANRSSKISKIKEQSNADIGANVASGSYPADAMIVLPCSVGTLARIANGVASHLIERAADVCLKEKRPLILCVRETPLNKIHIRNLYRAADAGATIFPLIPAFYYRPANLDDMAREFAYRVLAHLGLRQPDAAFPDEDRLH